MRCIHLSDEHWHSDNGDNQRQLAVIQALRPYRKTHYLLGTGDITDDGGRDQYLRVQDAMAEWKGRWFFCPGNHDCGWAGWEWRSECAIRFDMMLSDPFHQGRSFFAKEAPVVNLLEDGKDRVLLVALNSVPATVDPGDFACGEIGRVQLEALSGVLKTAPPGVPVIVMVHHHPWYHWHPFMYLKDAGALLMRLRGKIDLLLFGHRHKGEQWRDRWNIPWSIAAPSTPEAGWADEIVIEDGHIEIRRLTWTT